MTIISQDCTDNAIGMLHSKPFFFLGWVGNIRYYVVDGKAWSLTLGGSVSRSDDSRETDRIVRMVKGLSGRVV